MNEQHLQRLWLIEVPNATFEDPIEPNDVIPCPQPVSASKILSAICSDPTKPFWFGQLQCCEKRHCGPYKKAERDWTVIGAQLVEENDQVVLVKEGVIARSYPS